MGMVKPFCRCRKGKGTNKIDIQAREGKEEGQKTPQKSTQAALTQTHTHTHTQTHTHTDTHRHPSYLEHGHGQTIAALVEVRVQGAHDRLCDAACGCTEFIVFAVPEVFLRRHDTVYEALQDL
jgi:hypothetical protein